MMKYYLILFSLIYSIDSNLINQQNCSVCEFGEYFNQLNGYGCFQKRDNETICTCPDLLWTINQPCRICNRKGICGPQTATCNETVVFDSIKKISHFACICSSTFILIGDKCPEETVNATTVFISNTTAVTNPTSTSTKNSISSTMQTDTKCNGNSHLFVEPILIILLNLVYFVNK